MTKLKQTTLIAVAMALMAIAGSSNVAETTVPMDAWAQADVEECSKDNFKLCEKIFDEAEMPSMRDFKFVMGDHKSFYGTIWMRDKRDGKMERLIIFMTINPMNESAAQATYNLFGPGGQITSVGGNRTGIFLDPEINSAAFMGGPYGTWFVRKLKDGRLIMAHHFLGDPLDGYGLLR